MGQLLPHSRQKRKTTTKKSKEIFLKKLASNSFEAMLAERN